MNRLKLRALRIVVLALFCACCSTLFGCADPDARTKITFILGEPEKSLKDRIAKLEVRVHSERADESKTFTSDELSWPVEIVAIPEGNNRASRVVTMTARALDGANAVIAEWSAKMAFAPKEQQHKQVPAGPVGTIEMQADAGPDMAADAGLDASTERSDGGNPQPERDAQGAASNNDAAGMANNCENASANIRCDDGNACNSTERCLPGNARADERGCMPGEDAVNCMSGSTCDKDTGKCSTCGVQADGDGDGARSATCAGNDCNDNDDTVAPGKTELCDGKDNDCDGNVDGVAANGACAGMAPRNGSASCENGRCLPRCDNPNFQIENGACIAPSGTCPIINPCAPGICMGGPAGTYVCECPAGFRKGLTRCAPVGAKRRTLGFETGCDGNPTPGMFAMGVKQIASSFYAACGVASLKSSGLTAQASLFEPGMAAVEGITGTVALAGTSAEAPLASELVITFSPAVNEVTLDAIDIDNAAGLKAVFAAADGSTLLDAAPAPAAGAKRVRVTHSSRTPIDHLTLSYTRMSAVDEWYVDELAFDVWGCGDGEIESGAGESCDDGNAAQCDGCDNGCSASTAGCLAGNACVANGAMDGCTICNATARADAGVDVAPSRDPAAGAGCPP